MKLLGHWKIILGLVLVFAAGAVTGSVTTHHLLKRSFEQALNFDRWKTGIMQVLQSKLNLTPAQHEKIEHLVDQRGREIRSVFATAFGDCGRIVVALQRQVDEELSPTQREIHGQMKKAFRNDLKRRFSYDLPPE